MNIAHLTASTFFGGPERQMLGLGAELDPAYRSIYISFAESGRCESFLREAGRAGFVAHGLRYDTPRLRRAFRELIGLLQAVDADAVCAHGYKANILGGLAARRLGIPCIAISRGWTGEDLKVRLYEWLDRRALRWADRVVCVSRAQAGRVARAGVNPGRIVVIHNAIRADRFRSAMPEDRGKLLALFECPPTKLIGAAGRLSPEKGFGVLIEAAARVRAVRSDVGFVLFGDGPLRQALANAVGAAGLTGSFVLPGLRSDLDCLLPHLDIFVLSSFTEGLPNVALEAMAAGLPVVATAVGGTPELVEDEVTGFLVPPHDPERLATRLLHFLANGAERQEFGRRGQERVRSQFDFKSQGARYQALFQEVIDGSSGFHSGIHSAEQAALAELEQAR